MPSHPDEPVVLVTGANRGLGLALVDALLRRLGPLVVMAARRPEAQECSRRLKTSPSRVRLVRIDLCDEDTMRGAAEVCAELGRLDVLVNCAGVNMVEGQPPEASKGPLAELSGAALTELFDVNARGPVLLVKHLATWLARSRRGLVVNLSTQRASLAQATTTGSFGYAMSKAALNMATRKLAAELQPVGVDVIALHPGWLRTGMGGVEAPTDPAQAAEKIVARVLDGPRPASGGFYSVDGQALPW
ncbi:MAG: SDR family oxidoreductase [Actinomycetota bacterium]|nr:SDR family oxidoreductase [Actinomycetota bacterium]